MFTGVEHRVEVARERFKPTSTNVIPLRKPPQRASGCQLAEPNCMGRPPMTTACRTICLSLCEGVSGAGAACVCGQSCAASHAS